MIQPDIDKYKAIYERNNSGLDETGKGHLVRVWFLKNSSKFFRISNPRRKRKFIALSALSTSIILGHLFFLATWLSGFLIAKCLGSKETGKRSRLPSITFPLGMYKIHLHHWLISSLAILIAMLRGCWFLPPDLFYGFLGGVAMQGIYYYDDWHRILRFRRSES